MLYAIFLWLTTASKKQMLTKNLAVASSNPEGTLTRTLAVEGWPRCSFATSYYWIHDESTNRLGVGGWDGWTRTNESRCQRPLPYHLATPHYGVAQVKMRFVHAHPQTTY